MPTPTPSSRPTIARALTSRASRTRSSRKIVHGCTSASSLANIGHEVERFRAFREAGLTEIALRVYDEPDVAIRTIGEHIVPALRH